MSASRAAEGTLAAQGPCANPEYPSSQYFAFVIFLAFVAFSYLQAGIRFPVLGSLRAEFLLGMGLTVLSVAAIKGRAPDFRWTSVAVWALLLILLLLLMSLLSIDFATSWPVFVDRVFKFSLLGLFIAAFVSSPDRMRWFIAIFLLSCAKMGQEGFLGTIDGSMMWENQGVLRLHGSTPNYAHPNSFSGMALGTMPYIAFIFPLVSTKWRVALIILLIFMLNIVLRTGSRTGYVGFVVGLLWLITYSRHRVRAFSIVAVAVVLVFPFIPDQYIERAASIFESAEVGEDSSSGQRREILVDAWQIFQEYPFGVGTGAFPVIRLEKFGRFQDTHNLYLEVGTNAGVQGLFIFSGLVIAVLLSLRKSRQSIDAEVRAIRQEISGGGDPADYNQKLRDLAWLKAVCSGTIGFVVIRLTLGVFGHDLYERYWWFAAGIAIATANICRMAVSRHGSPN